MINFDEVIDIDAVPKESQEQLDKKRYERISGRIAALSFSVILLLGLIAVLAIGLQFQRIMQNLNASRSAWGAASSELTSRFSTAEAYFKTVNYLDNSPSLTDWSYYYNQFSKSRQFDRQVESAQKLEGMLEAILSQKSILGSPITPLSPSDGMLDLLENEKKRKESETSFLGSWTKTLLRLKTPQFFESVSKQ
ncbi:MAG: hypothetical protein ACK449_17305 [Planctomycetota bacterium]